MPVKPPSQTGLLVLQKGAKLACWSASAWEHQPPTLFPRLKCLAPLVGKILPPAAREITHRSWSSFGLNTCTTSTLVCLILHPLGSWCLHSAWGFYLFVFFFSLFAGAILCICTIFYAHIGPFLHRETLTFFFFKGEWIWDLPALQLHTHTHTHSQKINK